MKIKKLLGVLALVPLFLVMALPVQSAGNWLEVRIVDKQSGEPVAQAAVCLGTSASPDQFGARRVAADGTVRFDDLPMNSMVLTTSRRGYLGKRQVIEPLSGNRVIVVNLVRGGGGPVCNAAQSVETPPATGELDITDVKLSADTSSADGRILIAVQVSGQANQIRIAESADFAGAAWQDLKPRNRYKLSPGKGLKRLYIQVRRQVKTNGASIEVLSPVKVVSYRRN